MGLSFSSIFNNVLGGGSSSLIGSVSNGGNAIGAASQIGSSGGLGSITNLISSLFPSSSGQGISAGAASSQGAAGNIFQSIGMLLINVASQVQQAMGTLIQGICSLFSGGQSTEGMGGLGSMFSSIGSGASDMWSGIKDYFTGLIGKSPQQSGNLLLNLWNTAKGLLGSIFGGGQSATGAMGAQSSSNGFLGGLGNILGGLFGGNSAGSATGATGGESSSGGFWSGLWDGVKGLFGGLFGGGSSSASGASSGGFWSGLWSGITSLFGGGEGGGGFLSGIGSWFSGLFG